MAENSKIKNPQRRQVLQKSAIAGGAVFAAQSEWAKPVINSIVLPAHAQTSMQTIAEVATATDILSTLVGALTAGQVSALSGAGPLTVFAPTNAAFSAIQSTIDMLSAAEITAIIDYHVLAGDQPFSAIPTTTGTPPNLVTTVNASNGTVYVIDQVLIPNT